MFLCNIGGKTIPGIFTKNILGCIWGPFMYQKLLLGSVYSRESLRSKAAVTGKTGSGLP